MSILRVIVDALTAAFEALSLERAGRCPECVKRGQVIAQICSRPECLAKSRCFFHESEAQR